MCSKIISSLYKIKWFWLTFKNVHSFDVAFLHLLVVVFPPIPLSLYRKPCWLWKILPNSKDILISPIRKTCRFPGHIPYIRRKKGISNGFKTSFTRSFVCSMLFQVHNHDLFDGTMSLDIKQCPAGIFSSVILKVSPFLQKMFPPLMLLYWTQVVWTVPPSPEAIW